MPRFEPRIEFADQRRIFEHQGETDGEHEDPAGPREQADNRGSNDQQTAGDGQDKADAAAFIALFKNGLTFRVSKFGDETAFGQEF